MWMFCSPFGRAVLRTLKKNERCEQIAHVTHQKWAMWANPSSRSPKMSDHERFAHQKWATMSGLLRSLTKNERIARFCERIAHLLIFSQKTSDSVRKPMSEFPALPYCYKRSHFTNFFSPCLYFLSYCNFRSTIRDMCTAYLWIYVVPVVNNKG